MAHPTKKLLLPYAHTIENLILDMIAGPVDYHKGLFSLVLEELLLYTAHPLIYKVDRMLRPFLARKRFDLMVINRTALLERHPIDIALGLYTDSIFEYPGPQAPDMRYVIEWEGYRWLTTDIIDVYADHIMVNYAIDETIDAAFECSISGSNTKALCGILHAMDDQSAYP